mgnify:CR=1 FL=1
MAQDLSPAQRTLTVGVLGAGTVGSQVIRLLTEQADDFAARSGARLEITGVAVRDVNAPRDFAVPQDLLTDDATAVATGNDLVIELIGGIEPARTLILAAFKAGASVITGNKALIAAHGPELYTAAAAAGTDFYYEAAVAGAIPVVYALRESMAGDRVTSVLGIVNGTTNYILDEMSTKGLSFETALATAQELGYAEADPTADVDGLDAAAKAAIIASLAFHTRVGLDDVSVEGIREVTADDIVKQYSSDKLGDLTLSPESVTGELSSSVTDNAGWSAFLTGTPLGQWYFAESTTWFLILAIIIGIVGGLSEHEIVDNFMAGAGDMMSVVLIIAVSRGVSVLMSSTGLSDYFLNAAAEGLSGTSGIVFTIGSYLLYFVLSFLIPSTSGMATVSMPIMGPLAVKLGFNPAVMIMIFSAASGAVNLITPTNGAIMGGLALSRIEYGTWVKFAIKVVATIAVVSMVILAIAMLAIPAAA